MLQVIRVFAACALLGPCLAVGAATAAAGNVSGGSIDFKTAHLQLSLSPDARVRHFIDLSTGKDYALPGAPPIASIWRSGRETPATRLTARENEIELRFGDDPLSVRLLVAARHDYLTIEVRHVQGENLQELRFLNLSIDVQGRLDDPFTACAMALNLKTNVPEMPGPSATGRASCYPRFGMTGAQVALIGCPTAKLRTIMQQVVREAPELPKSSLGGPWALDAPINRGSYLFNFGDLSEDNVDRWIDTARRIGFNQIDFHGGNSFRFGDLRLNPTTYPKGVESLRAVIDKLHAAGISAGLHTYAFFVDKNSTYVTPRPDPRLAKAATFTLAADLPAEATHLPVVETTKDMSTTTGFFVRNSVTLQIGDELITYSGISKEPPYAFTGCKRGAYGTRVAAHARGAKVHHLKEQFGLFLPDGDSGLFEEVARRTAGLFNQAGFDMIYLDALDGEGIVGGNEAGWHYGSKFVFHIMKHLERPALMEMSTFHHHLWYARSRYVAWDHPNRGYKRFIDVHCAANDDAARMFLPGHLGWWRVRTWHGPQDEPTYADDIEYLMVKCLARGEGLSLQGIDPASIEKIPAFPRLAEIMQRYEKLRYANRIPASLLARLREPGAEFTFAGPPDQPRFHPVRSLRQTVSGRDDGSAVIRFDNPFAPQAARVRIQMLLSVAPSPPGGKSMLSNMTDPAEFAERSAASGVRVSLEPAAGPEAGMSALAYSAENSGKSPRGAWSMVQRAFTPPLDLSPRPGLGLWVRGDGRGEVLNVQLRCPPHVIAGLGEHYVPIDFEGWRYVELVEVEGDRCADYAWPYSGNVYGLYREEIALHQVAAVGLWYNNIPAGGAAECLIGPIEALPLAPGELKEIALTCGGRELRIKGLMQTGQYLELDAQGRARLYGPDGEDLADPVVEGGPLVLASGENTVQVRTTSAAQLTPRVRVMLSSVGDALE